MPSVLVVDDDRSIHLLIRKMLEPVADVVAAERADEGIGLVQDGDFDVILLDIRLPDRSGMAVLSEIQQIDRRLPVVFMTIEATSETAIEAMRLGAFDYLAKPLDANALRDLVARAIEQRALSSVPVAISADEELGGPDGELFIGRSEPMLDVFKKIGRVSNQDIPVLIRGESGTGKELVARALFHHGNRQEGPFLAVNCAALPENLLESELFGHEKGAFTGAESRRIGKFEQCDRGTLFLDEVGDMAPSVQAKVLRVLQEQRFERLGGNRELSTDVRLVAATNQNLESMVGSGDYREDLLYRINGVTITLPPLRERRTDIPLLVQYFLSQAKRDLGKSDLEGITPEAVERLSQFDWPGNVRQLRSVIRQCVLDTVLPVITAGGLPPDIAGSDDGPQAPRHRRVSQSNAAPSSNVALSSGGTGNSNEVEAANGPEHQASDAAWGANPTHSPRESAGGDSLSRGIGDREGGALPELVERLLKEKSTNVYAETMEYMERYVLIRVLQETNGNQSQAAEILGITRGKLRDRIHSYHISLENEISIKRPELAGPTAATG